jgi:rubredoxin
MAEIFLELSPLHRAIRLLYLFQSNEGSQVDDNRAGIAVPTDHQCECPVCGRRVGTFEKCRQLLVSLHFKNYRPGQPMKGKPVKCRGSKAVLCEDGWSDRRGE